MTDLATQQHALLAALFDTRPQFATEFIASCPDRTRARGLKAYQTHGHLLAQRCLQSAFPVLAQLLGEESLAGLARAFWHAHPPTCGDLAQWGGALADFLRLAPSLQDTPFLPDVAALEWALHACAGAPDPKADPASLALLMQHDPAGLHLTVAPGSAVLGSAWPVLSIWRAHQTPAPLSLAEAGQRVRDGVAEDAVIWREGFRPRVRDALAGETAFLGALHQSMPLGQALDAAPALDFNTWLPLAVQTGLLPGVSLGAARRSNNDRDDLEME